MTAVLIPARQGRAVRVPRGAAIDVINTRGNQVVDFWALAEPDTSEHLSLEHTRIAIGRLMSRQLGFKGRHDSCHDNFDAALRKVGITPPALPSPLNLFMNVPWSPDGDLRYEPPVNGAARQPASVEFRVHDDD